MKRLGPIFVLIAACSSNETTPASPSDAGAEAEGPPSVRPGDANDWACLGKVTLPPSTEPATMDLRLANALDQPVADVTVRACPDRTDATCAGGIGPKTTDGMGHVFFDLPPSFDGYYEAVEPGVITDLHYAPFAQWRTTELASRVQWHFDELRLLTDTLPGFTFDTTKGHVLMQVVDCDYHWLPGTAPIRVSPPHVLAGGVTLTLDPPPPGVVTAYVELEPHGRIRTDIDETADGSGQAGFLNVPPGVYTVSAKRKSTGERVASQRIHVRADAFSLLVVAPSP